MGVAYNFWSTLSALNDMENLELRKRMMDEQENKKLKSKYTCKMEYLVGLRCYR